MRAPSHLVYTLFFSVSLLCFEVQAAQVDFDVTGINSWDLAGDPNNEVHTIDVAAALGAPTGTEVVIDSVGWDVTITTVGGSWGSEMDFSMGPVGTPEQIFTPSVTGAPVVAEVNNSGGLLPLGTSITLANGVLELEFSESFDDIADGIDGTWDSGLISFNATAALPPPPPAPVPSLSLWALLGLTGLLGLFGLRNSRLRREP